jgi:hypothetical protein
MLANVLAVLMLVDVTATGQGRELGFTIHSLALGAPAEMEAHVFPTDFNKYAGFNQVPGSYVAVVASGGSHWFGRSGSVQLGTAGAFIIVLDKKASSR